jgi:hypothetical protein
MSIFEHGYDAEYQRYLDWKSEQEEQAEEMREYMEWEERRQQADDEAAEGYLEDVAHEKAANELGVIHEEDEEEEEDNAQQLAQITVDGVYRYEIMWLPDTDEVRVEVENFPDVNPTYYWYPDTLPILKTMSILIGCEEKDVKIEGLAIFSNDTVVSALPYEVECFCNSTWHDYASEDFAVQFNVNTQQEEEEDNWRNNHPTRHGLDGTQCDCSMCERANEMPEDMDPYHESVDENRLPTVYECLNLPKRVVDALIRNWVASQPDEDKAVKEAAELSVMVRKVAEQM